MTNQTAPSRAISLILGITAAFAGAVNIDKLWPLTDIAPNLSVIRGSVAGAKPTGVLLPVYGGVLNGYPNQG